MTPSTDSEARNRISVTLLHQTDGCQSDRQKVEYPSLWLKSKGDDGLQRTGKATSETRRELWIQEQKVRLLFFCLSLCSPPVLGGLVHKRGRETDRETGRGWWVDWLMHRLPVFFSTCWSNSLLQTALCALWAGGLMIKCLSTSSSLLQVRYSLRLAFDPPTLTGEWLATEFWKKVPDFYVLKGEPATFLWDWVKTAVLKHNVCFYWIVL